MLFLVIAHDGHDPEAPERRAAVREQHLQEARPLAEDGTMRLGGAYLDAAGGMAGSVLILEADDEAAVRALLERDIYHREGVWQRYEIRPFVPALGSWRS